MSVMVWIGIVVCLAHSAMFSGLNLGMFGISRLRLEIESASGSRDAARIMALRQDSHFLLTTILWGNVAVNCLLTLLCDSFMAGVWAFTFSTVGITLFGEIAPQAYFSRHALRVASALSPVLRAWQVILYPVARPTGRLLDWWLGREGIAYFRERDVREFLKHHIRADEAEIDHLEGVGALNFLALDDLAVREEGEPIDPRSVIRLPVGPGQAAVPALGQMDPGAFLESIQASGKKWIVLADTAEEPRLVLNADGYLRDVLHPRGTPPDPLRHCHRPVVVRDPQTPLGEAIARLTVEPEHPEDDVIDHDLILVWSHVRRVITGADLLGRLLRGIVRRSRSGDRPA